MSLQEQQSSLNENTCKNCGNNFQGTYCNKCGQKVLEERNTLKHFFNLVFDSFDIHRGVLFTAKMLFINPGKLINDYLGGKTRDYYNPLRYLIIVAGLYAILMIWFNILDANIETSNELFQNEEEQTKLQSFINSNIKKYLNLIPILILPFWSLVSKWILRKRKLYYAEYLIINCYLHAQYLLVMAAISLILLPFPQLSKFIMIIGPVVIIAYYSYAFRSIFKFTTFKSIYSSLSVILLGIILFYTFLILVMIIVIVILHLNGVDLKELVQ